MNSAAQIDSELFGGAPWVRLYRRCGLLRPGPSVARRGVIAVCIAWLPLAVLTLELQWFGRGGEVDAGALSRQDFSATADLYSVVSNVHRMRLVVYDLQGVLLLLCVTAAPFVPVMLLAVPIETILARAAEVLL